MPAPDLGDPTPQLPTPGPPHASWPPYPGYPAQPPYPAQPTQAQPGWQPYPSWPAAPLPPARPLATAVAAPADGAAARRRTAARWGVGAAVALLLVVGGLGVGVAHWLDGSRAVSDRAERVTLAAPNGWSDVSSADAGEVVEQGEDRWTVPDLELESLDGDTYVSVWVEDSDGAGPSTVHQQTVDDLCAEDGCVDRGRPEATKVGHRPALEQVLRHPAVGGDSEVSVVVTVWVNEQLVTGLGEVYADDEASLDSAVARVSGVLHTLQLR